MTLMLHAVFRSQLAVEAIFLETALAVLQQGADKLSERQAAALEGLAFDWIVNAERYIDARYPELIKCRDKMVRTSARWAPLYRRPTDHCKAHCSTAVKWLATAAADQACVPFLGFRKLLRSSSCSRTITAVSNIKQVVESCALMLGALSDQRLPSIVARLLREMCEAQPPRPARLRSDSPAARAEILQMCKGIRHVRLPLGSSAQVFRQAAPLIR